MSFPESHASRRRFLAGAACAAFGVSGRAQPAAKRPNIVWIMLDDLGYGDVGCYGQKKIQTPHIDRLATQGMRFTDCYAGASVCAPSRSVLMTGLHTGHTPVRANAGTVPLTSEDRTVAQMLHEAGYRTGLFGKWGLGDAGSTGVPTKKGFDEAFGYLHQIHAHSYYPDFLWHNEQKVPLPGNANGQHGQYSADLIADKALDFVRRNQGQPFFLYAAFTLPHNKYEVPDISPYADKDWPETEKIYAAMVTRADRHIGALLKLLADLKLEQDTIVFFTSDNGAPSAEAHSTAFFQSNSLLRGQKTQLYEGGLRVPMIVRWPGRVAAGSTSNVPWYFCDFLPTAAELIGAKSPSATDGVSMLPVLTGKQRAMSPRLLYWEQYQFDRKTNDLRKETLAQAARWGDWKAIRHAPGAPLELYNLRTDLAEKTNVAAANEDVTAQLADYLRKAHAKPRPHNTGSFEFVR